MIREILLLCLIGSLIQSNAGQSTSPSSVSAEICASRDQQIVVGTPFTIKEEPFDEFEIQDNCTLWMNGEQTVGDWATDGFDYVVYTPGEYDINCSSKSSQNLSVVTAEYVFSMCRDCEFRRSQLHVTTGDSVRWVLLPDRRITELETSCTMELQDEGGNRLRTFPAGVTTHTFEQAGQFRLSCLEQDMANISAMVLVTDGEDPPWDNKQRFRPLLYTHVALMAAAFGVLLPLATFLHYHGLSLAYKILTPLAAVSGVCGLVLVVVFVKLVRPGEHFRFFVHGVVGVALLALLVLALPLLLLHRKSRDFGFRLGHVLAFFGMGNVLVGLTIITQISLFVRITLSIIYGLWLVIMILFYIFHPKSPPAGTNSSGSGKKNTAVDAVTLEMTSRNGSLRSIGGGSTARKDSGASQTSGRGPQPLRKSIIGEDKMVQLRKKSLDFAEAQKHMRALNQELGIKHQLARELEEGGHDEGFKVRMELKRESSSEDPTNDDSRAPLHQSSPETDDPFTSSPVTSASARPRRFSPKPEQRTSTSDEEDDDDDDENDDKFQAYLQRRAGYGSYQGGVNRANTFSCARPDGSAATGAGAAEEKNYDSDNSERGGSLRITRHSKRARGKLEHIFKRPDLDVIQSPTSPPSFNITPSTPPPHHAMLEYKPPAAEITDSFAVGRSTGLPKVVSAPALRQPTPDSLPLAKPPATSGRRRRAGMAPTMQPPYGGGGGGGQTSLEAATGGGGACPFHQPKTPSPKPCRRGISPTNANVSGGGTSDDGASPRPVRKKKVSVAQIEATVVPPTPVNLAPPAHMQLGRSPSFNTIQGGGFADNAFRSVMQISQDAICCANSVGDIVFWSAGASKMFGYTPGEAIGSSLEMIIPQSYKEKHRNGISKRADDTLKYIRKHSYAPEEQKHARLYAVHGVTKGGHEFPVEVNVTSFVLDGEIFFTGVISELAKTSSGGGGGSMSGSSNDLNEIALKQRALAVGAQMKIAHNLRSAEHISQRELERVLKGSLGTSFAVDDLQMEQMITGIMKAGDPEDTGAISFVGLIQLLSKHQLYISESGLIARYGKTKSSAQQHSDSSSHHTCWHQATMRLQQFMSRQSLNLVWILLYIVLNLSLFAIGVGAYSRTKEGWRLWAFGTGPVLSMNCVLVLLPTLSSLVHAMRNSRWMMKVFPLKSPKLFHVAVSLGILFWTCIHLLTHFCSFGLTYGSFKEGMSANLFPVVSGFIVVVIFAVMGVTGAIRPIRSALRFIPFRFIHWVGAGLFYLLLLVHGVNYWNPSFWKWLLPAVIIFIAERIYRHGVVKKVKVNIRSAGRYDSVSRTAIVEMDKPKRFEFEPGQYILFNMHEIGKFEWQPCYVSSGPKEEKLTIHIPFSSDIWFKKAFEYLKQHPHNLPQPGQQNARAPKEKNARLSEVEDDSLANQLPAHFTGPYGPTWNSKLLFKYKVSTVVCGGDGPHIAKAIIKKFLNYRKAVNCHCGCQPLLAKLYFVWVIPSGNDFEWFTDYLSDLCEDDHLHRYLDIRVFLTNCDSAPDELASALLQLGLKTAGDKVTVRRPSQPQLNNLYHMTSYGLPDFTSLLDYISTQHSSLWTDKPVSEEFGVFVVGDLQFTMNRDLKSAINKSSKPGQLTFVKHTIA